MVSLRDQKWFLCLLCASLLFMVLVRIASFPEKDSDELPFPVARQDNCPDSSLNSSATLFDLHDFKFVVNNASKCRVQGPPYIVVLVHTAPGNFKRRESIRATWGNEDYWLRTTGHVMRIVFLIGQTVNGTHENYGKSSLQSRLEQEHDMYGDLVQGTFVDSYRNLTYKHVMGLLWVSAFCPKASHVLKVDDDVFVDLFQLNGYLRSDQASDLIHCWVCQKCFVKRGYRTEKWHVSFKEYSPRFYPDFCAGIGVIMSPRAATKLYLTSCRVPFFWIDDAYVTGILAEAAGIKRVDIGERITISEELVDRWLESTSEPQKPLPVMIAHSKHFDHIVHEAWKKTLRIQGHVTGITEKGA